MLANSRVRSHVRFSGWWLLVLVATTLFLLPARAQQASPPSDPKSRTGTVPSADSDSNGKPDANKSIKRDADRPTPAKNAQEAPGKSTKVTAAQIQNALLEAAAKLVDLKITIVEKGNFNERTEEMPVPVVFKEMWMHDKSMQVRMDWRNDGNGDEWWRGFKSTQGPLATAHFDSKTELRECMDQSRELAFADCRPLSPDPDGEPRSLYSVSKSSQVISNLFAPLVEFKKPWVSHRPTGAPMVDEIARLPLSAWHLLDEDKLGEEEVIQAEIDRNRSIAVPLKQHPGDLKVTPVYRAWFAKRYGMMPLRIEASMRYSYQDRDYRLECPSDRNPSQLYEASDFQQFKGIWVPRVGHQRTHHEVNPDVKGFAPDSIVEKLLAEGSIRLSGEQRLGYSYEWRVLSIEPIDPSLNLWLDPHDGAEVFNMDTHKHHIHGDTAASARIAAREQAIEALVGKNVPEFPEGATWLNGQPLTWKALRGKVVILNFWAEWCGPCQNDLPQLDELHDDRNQNGLAIIGVHVSGSEMAAVRKAVDEFQINYPVCIDVAIKAEQKAVEETGFSSEFTSKFAVHAIPHFVVVDRKGIVAASLCNRFEDARIIAEKLTKASD